MKKVTVQEQDNASNRTNISVKQPCFQALFIVKDLQQNSSFLKHFLSVDEP